MRKIISATVLVVMLSVLVVPAVSLAQSSPSEQCTMKYDVGVASCPSSGTVGSAASGATVQTEDWGMCCLLNALYSVTNWIFYLLMVFVVVMIVIGGAMYMMSAGDPEKAGKGKGIIIYGIIGLVIALVAKLIPSVVKMIVGM